MKPAIPETNRAWFYLVITTLLLSAMTSLVMRTTQMHDPDIWWHLRTGQWIVEHRNVPQSEPFAQRSTAPSQFAGEPALSAHNSTASSSATASASTSSQATSWIAYSWLFELLIYGLVQTFGLSGILIYTGVLSFLILFTLLLHLYKLNSSCYQIQVLLTILAGFVLWPILTPRSWLITILFFLLEYALLEASYRSQGNQKEQRRAGRRLWWLVPVFMLWANLHIQFIYGLFLLGFFTIEPLIEACLRGSITWRGWQAAFRAYLGRSEQRERWALFVACCFATLATPYHIRIYQPVFECATQTKIFGYVEELQPLTFGQPFAWILLALVCWLMFRLGTRPIPRRARLLLLMIGMVLSFRSMRDSWFLTIIAVTMLMETFLPLDSTQASEDKITNQLPAPASSQAANLEAQTLLGNSPPDVLPRWAFAALCGTGLLGLWLITQQRGPTNKQLQAEVDQHFPAAATRMIAERGYQGPLYNHFNWGGYLIWTLPHLPVSMDGRTNVYGEERILRALAVWRGKSNWTSDPDLQAARIIIAEKDMALTELLRRDTRYTLVHEDSVSALFVTRQADPKVDAHAQTD